VKQANTGAASSAPVHVPSWAYPLVTVAGLLLGVEAVVRGTRAVVTIADSDLTNFFFRSADYILNGDPWHMYAVRATGAYPNYNPPLSIALMAPLLALARAVGFAKNYGELITFVSIPFLLFVPLLGYLVLRVLRQLYPEMPEAQRLIAYALILLSPLTWQTYGTWYHIEQPMMLCLLVGAVLALQQRREGLAGLLAGLALMTRTTALIPLLALGLLLILWGEWRALSKLAGVALAVVAVIMAPFFLVDRADTTYSFLTWRGSAPIGGNSIWSIFAAGDNVTGLRHTLDAVARRLDMPSVIVFVLIATILVVRKYRVTAYQNDVWAVLAIAALAVPMLSKTNWPYYYLEPFVPLLIWEFSSMHDRRPGVWRWPVLSMSFLATASTLSQYIGLQSVGFLDRVGVGLLEFGSMLTFAVLIWLRMQAAKPAPVAAGAAYTQNRNQGNLDVSPQTTAKMPPIPQRGAPAMTPGGIPAELQRGMPAAPQHLVSMPAPPPIGKQQPQQAIPSSESAWPNLSPPTTSAASPFGVPRATGGMPQNTPPWQTDGGLPSLPDQWPDLHDLGDMGGWRSSEPQPPQNPATGPGR
jgi:hypothetical protein